MSSAPAYGGEYPLVARTAVDRESDLSVLINPEYCEVLKR